VISEATRASCVQQLQAEKQLHSTPEFMDNISIESLNILGRLELACVPQLQADR
jgi:hypothetical protein